MQFSRSQGMVHALNAALVSILALSGYYWTTYYMDQKYRVLLDGSRTIESRGASTGFSVDDLVASHVFGIPDQVEGPSQANIPLSSLNLKLAGVIASDRGGFALISVNGQPQAPFFIGEKIVDNAVLDSVLPDRIILIRNGIKESLLLDSDAENTSAVASPLASPDPRTGATGGLLKKIGDNRYQVNRSLVKENTSNPDLLRQALIVPNEGGGFLVKNIQAGSVIDKLGLKAGDVITKVNNLPLNSMVDVMQLYRLTGDINKINNVNVEVVRNGQAETLNYNLR